MLGLNLSACRQPTSAWWTPGAVYAADFVNDRYMRDGIGITRDEALTVTRSTPKLARTVAGQWLSFPPDTLARTDRGASIEPASTNYVQNSTMAGAIPGSPGTAPTGWTVPASVNGLVRQIVAVGTSNGLPHLDIRFSGTTTAESFANINLSNSNQIATLPGDTWTFSCGVTLIAGSLAGLIPALACRLRTAMFSASNGYLGELMNDPSLDVSGGSVQWTQTATVMNANAAYLMPYLQFWYYSGGAIDLTVRLSHPQLERNMASSPIQTSAGTAEREEDAVSLNLPAISKVAATFSDHSEYLEYTTASPYLVPVPATGISLRLIEGFGL